MKPLKSLANIVVITVLLLAFLEGVASLTLVAVKAWRVSQPFAETLHTQPDADLVWEYLPNTKLEDMYGPGTSLTINAQGFRGEAATAPVPADRTLRIVCSGDSFTLM